MSNRDATLAARFRALESEIMDLDRLSYLVASHAQDAVPAPADGEVMLAVIDCEAMLFGIFEMHRRAKELRLKLDGVL